MSNDTERVERFSASMLYGIDRFKAMIDKIDESVSNAPLEMDHGHHVDDNGWLKGKLDA